MPIPSPSNDFVDTLRFGSFLMVAEITVYQYDYFGSPVATFYAPCSAASVTVDRNSAQRRSGSISVELVPSIPVSVLLPTAPPSSGNPEPLTPFGNEISVSLGIATGNASPTPLALLELPAPANAEAIQVNAITNNGITITNSSTIVIGNAAPVEVISITGSGPYWVGFSPPLSSAQPVGSTVQLTQFVPLGLFTTTTTTVDATASNLVITLDISDRSFIIDARELTMPYTFPATASGTYEDEVVALLNMAWGSYSNMPPLQFSFSNFNNPIVPTAHYGQGSSPWQMALDLAQVAGNELYVSCLGIVTSHVYPDVNTQAIRWWFTDDSSAIFSDPTKTIESGSPYTVPIGVQVTFTRSGIYNDVYITGSGTQNAPGASTSSSTATGGGASTSTTSASPVLGHAVDLDPGSATYVNGPLGDLPEFTSSNLVPTAAQAQAMASLDLAMSISSAWQIQITTPPNPLIDVDDIVAVYYPSVGVSGPNGEYLTMIVDTVTSGVTYADTMTITGRVIPGRYS